MPNISLLSRAGGRKERGKASPIDRGAATPPASEEPSASSGQSSVQDPIQSERPETYGCEGRGTTTSVIDAQEIVRPSPI